MSKKRVFFADLPIDVLTLNTVVGRLKKMALTKTSFMKIIVCLNAHNVNLCYQDQLYQHIVKQADLITPDGWGVVWAGKLLGYKLKERTTTADYFLKFCLMLERNNLSIYCLGSTKKIIKKTVKSLKQKFPKLKIVGFHSGFFDKNEEKKIIKEINRKEADFLLVGMGTPKQEKWLYQNGKKLKAKVGWGVGAMFDYLAGEKKRCPKWLGRLGVEWLFRLIQEPKRLGRRYIFGNLDFVFRCFIFKFFP